MPATAPLKFNEKGELVSEILPCGCEYEVISEKALTFYVFNENSTAQHVRDVARRQGTFCKFPAHFSISPRIL